MKEQNKIRIKKTIFILTVVAMTVYFGWRLFFTLPFRFGPLASAVGVILLITELTGALETFELYRNYSRSAVPELPVIPAADYPEVDVLIATHNESAGLLYKTVNACRYMVYPDKNRVHIYLCDDTGRAEVAALARQMDVGYFGLRDNPYAKAGNLNNAIFKTHSPLIATFDADMIPTHDFLMKTVPYFFLEEGPIGFIQSPQSFYNADLFQYNLYSEKKLPNEQDYFFKEVNVNRNYANAPIYAGSNTLISRRALTKVGGIATDSITEDFATGIRIQAAGYRCYAIPTVLAHGLAPATLRDLISQRRRWGRGCVQTLRQSHWLRHMGLPLRTRLSYYSSFLYWWAFFRRFVYISAPILFTLFQIVIVDCTVPELLIFSIPAYLLYGLSLQFLSGSMRSARWSNIIDTALFPYLTLPIILETLGIREKKFSVTRKDAVTDSRSFTLALPHLFFILLSALAIYQCYTVWMPASFVAALVVMYWLVLNTFILIMAVFFILGRKNSRKNVRFSAELPVLLKTPCGRFSGHTLDISKTGMAIALDTGKTLDPSLPLEVLVQSGHYRARLEARVVRTDESRDGALRYGLVFTSMDAENRSQYFQIVYDREPDFPTRLVKSSGLRDLGRNILQRFRRRR